MSINAKKEFGKVSVCQPQSAMRQLAHANMNDTICYMTFIKFSSSFKDSSLTKQCAEIKHRVVECPGVYT